MQLAVHPFASRLAGEGLPLHRHTFCRSMVIGDTATRILEQAIIVIAEDTRFFVSFHGASNKDLTSAHTSGTLAQAANAKVNSR